MALVKPLKISSGVMAEIPPTVDIVQLKSLGLGGAPNNTAGQIRLGAAGAVQGTALLEGLTSGVITVTGKAVAGTWTMTLPDTGGTAGFVLQTDGAGITSWVTPGAAIMAIGSTVTGGVTDDILFIGAGPVLAQDGNFQWNPGTARVSITAPVVVGDYIGALIASSNAGAADYAAYTANNDAGGTSSFGIVSTGWTGGVNGATASSALIRSNFGIALSFNAGAGEIVLAANSTKVFAVNTGTTAYMPAGTFLGNGTTTPAYAFHFSGQAVVGEQYGFGARLGDADPTSACFYRAIDDTGSAFADFGIVSSTWTSGVNGATASSALIRSNFGIALSFNAGAGELVLAANSTKVFAVKSGTEAYMPAGVFLGNGTTSPSFPFHYVAPATAGEKTGFAAKLGVAGATNSVFYRAIDDTGSAYADFGIVSSTWTSGVNGAEPDYALIKSNFGMAFDAVSAGDIRFAVLGAVKMTISTAGTSFGANVSFTNLDFSGTTSMPAGGTAAAPNQTITGSTSTGAYSGTANTYSLAAGGFEVLRAVATGTGQVLINSGTLANPGLALIGSTSTGLYSTVANLISIAAGGAEMIKLDGTGTPQVSIPNGGSAGTPALFLGGAANAATGLFLAAVDEIAVSNVGLETIRFDANSFIQIAQPGLSTTPSLYFAGSAATGFYQPAADKIGIAVSTVGEVFEANANHIVAANLVAFKSTEHQISTVTTATTLDDTYYTVLADATGGAFTVTLPTAVSATGGAVGTGRVYVVKKTDASANTVTVQGNGAETIDGSNTQLLLTQWASIMFQSDGTAWYILCKN